MATAAYEVPVSVETRPAPPPESLTPPRRARAELEAVVAFAITFLLYFLGAGRSLDYDSSITVAHFVATPSLLDPFRREYVLNNHPLFSFLDHLVYSLGGHSEAALRVLPIGFGAAAVALVTWWCARRWGLLAGAAAALVVGSNQMLAEVSREVRGYSLVALSAVASTILFGRLQRRSSRLAEIAYVAALAVGIATHLYGLLIIPVHGAAVIANRKLSRRWLARWVTAVLLGLVPYVAIAGQVVANRGSRAFSPSFPHELAQGLLGTDTLAIIATLALATIAVASSWPLSRPAWYALAAVAAMIAGIWLIAQPAFLFPRFFVWLVPAAGLLAARAVNRWPPGIVLAGACAIAAVAYSASTWTEDPLPARTASAILTAVHARGLEPCVLGYVGESLAAYSPPPYRIVTQPSQLSGCAVALELEGIGPVSQARAALPYTTVLKGLASFDIYSQRPLGEMIPGLRELHMPAPGPFPG